MALQIGNIKNVSIVVIGIIDGSIVNCLSKNIEYLGSKDQEEVYEVSAEFDGLLLPYKQDSFSSTISPASFSNV